MAEYLSLGPVDPHTAMWMRDAVAARASCPTHPPARRPRATSPTATARRSGPTSPGAGATRWWRDALRAAVRGDRTRSAILEAITGVDRKELSEAVARGAAASRTGRVVAAKRDRRDLRARRSSPRRTAGELNVAPALSPDGSAWSSSRRRTCSRSTCSWPTRAPGRSGASSSRPASDPHFESLQFINSAGGWDAAGRRFAFGGVRKGQAGARILDADGGTQRAGDPVRELGRDLRSHLVARRPAGSRSPRMVGGLTDLFVYDLRGERAPAAHRTTPSPTCSRPGRRTAARIAFVDRPLLHALETLTAGNYRLAAHRPGGRRHPPAAQLRGRARTSTRSGRRTAPASSSSPTATASPTSTAWTWPAARRSQVTDLLTGVSGITALSPALSVGARPAGLQRLRGGQAPDLRDRGRRGMAGTALGDEQRPPARGHPAAAASAGARTRSPPLHASRPLGLPAPRSVRDDGLQARSCPSTTSASRRSASGRGPAAAPSSAAACRSCSATSSATTPWAPCCR